MRKIDEFKIEMEEPKKIYTEELKRFTALRKKADYGLSLDISQKEVSDAIAHMEKIFNQLEMN